MNILPVNSSSVILPIFLTDSTGAAATGVAHNASGLSAAYRHTDAATFTTITLASGTLGTYASGSWAEDTNGEDGDYQLGLPAGAINVQGQVVVRVTYDGVARTGTLSFTGPRVNATGQTQIDNAVELTGPERADVIEGVRQEMDDNSTKLAALSTYDPNGPVNLP